MIKFPTEFSIKIFGLAENDLEPIIIEVVRKHNIDIERAHITTRASSGGKYTAYTATFSVNNQEQLDNIYRDLSSHPQILSVI